MNWTIIFADDVDDEGEEGGSYYELYLLGYTRADAIIRAWEAVGDDARNLISAEPLPDAELAYINPDCVIRADGQKHPENNYPGARMGIPIRGDN